MIFFAFAYFALVRFRMVGAPDKMPKIIFRPGQLNLVIEELWFSYFAKMRSVIDFRKLNSKSVCKYLVH